MTPTALKYKCHGITLAKITLLSDTAKKKPILSVLVNGSMTWQVKRQSRVENGSSLTSLSPARVLIPESKSTTIRRNAVRFRPFPSIYDRISPFMAVYSHRPIALSSREDDTMTLI